MAKSQRAPLGAKSQDASPSSAPAAKDRPVHTIRYRGCEAAIWRNAGTARPFYSVTLRKSWRDREKAWHDSAIFLAADLPMLAKAITDAHSWIAWHERQEAKGEKGGG
jgi:hypothetical protein